MRIVSKAEEQEHLKDEALIRAQNWQSSNPLVEHYVREDLQLYALNEALLKDTLARKEVEDDDFGSDIDFD